MAYAIEPEVGSWTVGENEELTGGDVLWGFKLRLRDYFAEPDANATEGV
jgi:hypothetical protein